MSAQSTGLRHVLDVGFAGPLVPLGFTASRDRRTWVREIGGLCQMIAVWKRSDSFTVQWGIVCPELVDVMWAVPYKPFDVGQSIVTGTPSSIRHPAQAQSFSAVSLETEAERIAAGVREDVGVVTVWMEPLSTRRALREYLMENRDETDRRAFVIPAAFRLKLFTAAGLAIVDRDPVGCELLAEAEAVSAPINDEIRRGRFARLRAAAAGLCD
ncbi:MAG: hypothetical protein K8R99_02635 [Actinomycetia bacterium]|nr:hypothetical protein [Actinomycetes bacterium]